MDGEFGLRGGAPAAGLLDLSNASVVLPADAGPRLQRAAAFLVEEVRRRSHLTWSLLTGTAADDSGAAVILEAADSHADLAGAPALTPGADGYRLWTGTPAGGAGSGVTITIAGNDERGVLFGVGRLLRSLRLSRDRALLPELALSTAPRYPLRGHQLAYRPKTNSYSGWDAAQWRRYLLDLIVFGANAFEIVPPNTDDEPDSEHFPRPQLEMMAEISQACDDYGVALWIWYPLMDPDDSAALEAEWRQVFAALPRIDAVFVPGGDPGNAPPAQLFDLLERLTEVLRAYHPAAETWVSPQGFGGADEAEFYRLLAARPAWLSGVVHGPWMQLTTEEFRRRVPARYPVRYYPDVTHMMQCQYPVPDWDVAYAVTEGRECINPRPHHQAALARANLPYTCGVLAYNEGCHDDVNKALWAALSWDPDTPVIEVLREYARVYVDSASADDFAHGLLALERNWQGPLAANGGVLQTLGAFQTLERSVPAPVLRNWRLQQALYRAYYDAFVSRRLLHESAAEARACDWLRAAPTRGALPALARAEEELDAAAAHPVAAELRQRLFALAEGLFQSIYLKLSVSAHGAMHVRRGANLDGIDYPLNNRLWLKARFAEVRREPAEAGRLAAIRELLAWDDPGPGGHYDNLGCDGREPHLVSGPGAPEDAAYLRSALRGFALPWEPGPVRTSWISQAETLAERPLELAYCDLDPEAAYRLRVVYGTEKPGIRVRCDAAGGDGEVHEVHPWIEKPVPHRPLEYAIPAAATAGGELVVRFQRQPYVSGDGRGCQVCEVWLLKVRPPAKPRQAIFY